MDEHLRSVATDFQPASPVFKEFGLTEVPAHVAFALDLGMAVQAYSYSIVDLVGTVLSPRDDVVKMNS